MPCAVIEVLVVAGVADQRPAGAVRLAEEVGHGRAGEPALSRLAAADPLGERAAPARASPGSCPRRRPCWPRTPRTASRRRRASARRGSAHAANAAVVAGRRSRTGRPSAGRSSRCSSRHSSGGFSWYCSGLHRLGDHECRPSAPTTTRARSVDGSPPLAWPRIPVTRPSSIEELVDGEALADLGAGLGGGVDQQLVEHGAARAVRDGAVGGARRARERERAEVERVGVDRRAAGRHEPVEQAPAVAARRRPAGGRRGWRPCRSGRSPGRRAGPGSPCGPAASRSASRRSGRRRR